MQQVHFPSFATLNARLQEYQAYPARYFDLFLQPQGESLARQPP
jgi:hypothetical protein